MKRKLSLQEHQKKEPGNQKSKYRFTTQQALSDLRKKSIEDYRLLFEHGSLEVEIYAPRGTDRQEPHSRDEVYVVISGSGWFVNGDKRHPFSAGDLLFVPAGVIHRFVDFTDDFSTWVMFYGPEGGEASK